MTNAGDERYVPIPNATLSVVIPNPEGEKTTLTTIKSGPDGSFLLELPEKLPAGSVLIVSANGYDPFVQKLQEEPYSYHMLSFVLKKKKKE